MDDEIIQLKEAVNEIKESNIKLDEEIVLDKSAYTKKESQDPIVKPELLVDFSKMQKIDCCPVTFNDAECETSDIDDLQAFASSLNFPQKTKFSKQRTDEHSDKETTSESDNDIDGELSACYSYLLILNKRNLTMFYSFIHKHFNYKSFYLRSIVLMYIVEILVIKLHRIY